jgi:dTDP-glucose 4,6-dehydratase
MKQACDGESLTVYGSGSQTRSFCYVSDLVEGIYRLMLSGENLPVNIGNPHEFTVLELAQHIIALTHSSSEIVYQELPEDDPKKRKPDITKAKVLLGWEPKVLLPEGLAKTLASFQERWS